MKTQHFVSLLVLVGSLVATPAPAFAQKIYWTDVGTGKIQRANLDGTNVEDLVNAAPAVPGDIALHKGQGKIYWAEDDLIRRANLDGTNIETVFASFGIFAFAIDEVNQRMYLSLDLGFGSYDITRADLTGQNAEEIIFTGSYSANSIALDVSSQKLYWVTDHLLWRANLDGSQVEILVPDAAEYTGGVALDLARQKVYWVDAVGGSLRRANLDGTGVETLPIMVSRPIGIALDPCRQMVYWTEYNPPRIRRAGFDGSQIEDLVTTGIELPPAIALQLPYYRPNETPQCIPALSRVGTIVLAMLLVFSAWVVLQRRRRIHPLAGVIGVVAAMVLFAAGSTPVAAQSNDLIAEFEEQTTALTIDSGWVNAGGQGSAPVVIFSHTLEITGSPWLRLHFSEVTLSGSRSSGNASFVRVTGTHPGAVQSLDAVELQHWTDTSAYFNGDSVLIELLSYPNTGANRMVIDSAAYSEASGADSTPGICGQSDDRTPSYDPRIARFRVTKRSCTGTEHCTAFLIEGRPSTFLTAGHCCKNFPNAVCERPFSSIVEFNVPLSGPGLGPNPSLPMDQFPVDAQSVVSLDPSDEHNPNIINDGEDWCVLGVWRDPELGLTPTQRQHASFDLAASVPATIGKALRVTGHGIDSDPPGPPPNYRNQFSLTQQRATGPHVSTTGTIVRFRVSAQPGNSGSPVEHVCGKVYAILTDGGCLGDSGANLGTAIDHPLLVDALTPNIYDNGEKEPKGVAADCNENGIKDWCDVDCRGTGSPCNVTGCGQSDDCNHNDVPDECESTRDCNNNSQRDICEVYNNPTIDCNRNGVPDSCDLVRRCVGGLNGGTVCNVNSDCDAEECHSTSVDCNSNGKPDECDICVGTVPDCNTNFVPDACDISAGTSCDGDDNGVPDECQQPVPMGACCLDPGPPQECVATTQCACWNLGGNFAGVHTKCATIDCGTIAMLPQPVGPDP